MGDENLKTVRAGNLQEQCRRGNGAVYMTISMKLYYTEYDQDLIRYWVVTSAGLPRG